MAASRPNFTDLQATLTENYGDELQDKLTVIKDTLEQETDTVSHIYAAIIHSIPSAWSRQDFWLKVIHIDLLRRENNGIHHLLTILNFDATNLSYYTLNQRTVASLLNQLHAHHLLNDTVLEWIRPDFLQQYENLFSHVTGEQFIFLIAAHQNNQELVRHFIREHNDYPNLITAHGDFALRVTSSHAIRELLLQSGAKVTFNLFIYEWSKKHAIKLEETHQIAWLEFLSARFSEGISPEDIRSAFHYLSTHLFSDTFSLPQAKAIIFLIEKGLLNDPQNVITTNNVIKLNFFKSDNIRKKYPDGTIQVCLAIVGWISAHQPLTHAQKTLALNYALVTSDQNLVTAVTQLDCKEEREKITITKKKWLTTAASYSTINEHSKYLPTYRKIAVLLANTPLCIQLLSDLDRQLQIASVKAGITLTDFPQPVAYIVGNFVWPIFRSYAKLKTHDTLNELLLQHEREYGLNESEFAPVRFANFVDSEKAHALVKAGNLFQEFNYYGNLLHGKYSHRLQWYIITTAVEKGILTLDDTVSIRQLVEESPAVWQQLIDLYGIDSGFRTPHALHAALLLLDDTLPFLCAYVRNTHAKSVDAICDYQDIETNAEQVTAIYDGYAESFRGLFLSPDIAEHYARKGKEIKKESSLLSSSGTIFWKVPQPKEEQRGDAKTTSLTSLKHCAL